VKPPSGPWHELDEVESTQTVAAEKIRAGEPVGVVFAAHQTEGRGRLGRSWYSEKGDSLTMSLVFEAYADHPQPYLIGMACALAAAAAVHTQVRWPNDLLIGDKKVGGILTELIAGPGGLLPVVGIGINLNQQSFPPDLEAIATSLALEQGGHYEAKVVAVQVLQRISLMPEISDWSALAAIWDLFDRTPGKRYRLPNDDLAVAVGVGSDGQLICSVDGESQTVLAAEALFGHAG
jgi:BirA family transcriptional regulator, biotin operon repressor / biotin---[acetyl-CoA-carboxylase] ligase